MGSVAHRGQSCIPLPEGQKFGRLTVLHGPFRKGSMKWRLYYRCRCECGQERDILRDNLTRGNTVSCGCHRRDRLTTHGSSKSRIHNIWGCLRRRCGNPKHPDYPDYGGRGITVCPEWQHSFVAFRDWAMANGYADHLEIDRRDNDLGYSAGNCHWTTRPVQLRNTRRNNVHTAFGETKCFQDWVNDPRCTVTADTLRHRLKRWDFVRALTTPVTPKNERYRRLPE